MIRRILTVTLAVILAVETPMAAYAASPGLSVEGAEKEVYNETAESAEMSEEADDFDEAENPGGADGTEETKNPEEPEDTEETENPGEADGTGETKNPEEPDGTGETENPEEPDGTEETENPEEPDGTEETENPEEPEDTEETENPEEAEETEESTEDSLPSVKEDLSDTELTTVSENSLLTAAFSERAEETISLSFEKASAEGIEITVPYGADSSKNPAWLSFTAPEAGRYAFYTKEAFERSFHFIQCTDRNSSTETKRELVSSGGSLCVYTDYMEAGETLYIEAYADRASGETVGGESSYRLWAAYQSTLEKNSDGSYTASLPRGNRISFGVRAGCRRFQVKVTDFDYNQYNLMPFYCPADHSAGDQMTSDYFHTLSKGAVRSSDTLAEGTYETVYMIESPSSVDPFVGLFVGAEPLTMEGTNGDEAVRIHNAEISENKILLDLEVLVNNKRNLCCRYTSVDGSEELKTVNLSGWRDVAFEGLKAGTEYRFEFRVSSTDELLQEAFYRTTESGTVLQQASAAISADFSKITVQAKPVYGGTSQTAKILCSFTDSLGIMQELSCDIAVDEKDAQGFCRAEFDTAAEGIFLMPGAAYQMQVCMEFVEDAITTAKKTVNVNAPAQASVKEADIEFSVTQNAATRYHVDYSVKIPGFTGTGCIFYRPVGADKYKFRRINLKDGVGEDSFPLPVASLGSVYEFMLSVGGAVKTVSFRVENEQGVYLERVENATDYVGAFGFVRTYRVVNADQMTGSCYLQLKRLDTGTHVGTSVELNAENGYQAQISSLERSFEAFNPDTDYDLCWLLSSSKKVDAYDPNAMLSTVYERVHTRIPEIVLEKGAGTYNSQKFTVKLGERDVADLSQDKRSVTLDVFVRAQGDQAYTRKGTGCLLGFNSGYSSPLTVTGLKPNREYELSLRDHNGEKVYKTAAFRTAADSRKISITQIKPYVNRMEISYSLSGFGTYSKDYIQCYYRPKGSKGRWISGGDKAATSAGGRYDIKNLTENTTYEYQIGIGTETNTEVLWLTGVERGEFTTRSDTRRIEVTAAKTKMTSAKIDYHLWDMDVTGSNTVVFYTREKGKTAWEKKDSKKYQEGEALASLALTELQEDTVYEYRIGFADISEEPEDLVRVTEGNFQTAKDLREVDIVTEPTAYSAKIRYTLSGMEQADDGYLLCYSREASGEESEAWKKEKAVKADSQTTGDSFLITDLEESTAYELTMGFGTAENTGIDSLKRVKKFSFTTMEDSRSLSEAEAEVGDVLVTLRVKFSGNLEKRDSYVRFFYRVKGETTYKKAGRLVNMSGVAEDMATVTLSGLLKGTEYEFAAVLTNDGNCEKPEDVSKEKYKVFGSFITEEAVKPTALKISQEQLYLNANAQYTKEKGFGYENLKVQWEPFEASADLVWESSDKEIATVSADGKVSAVAAGTAVITARSVYAPELSVSCEVTVGDYQIGRKGADGSISSVENAKLTVARGVSCEGYVLCKIVDGNAVEVQDAGVVSNNESIAQWMDGAIETKRAGETRIVFTSEADQVQAFLTVSVQPSTGKGFSITGFKAGNSAYPALQEETEDSEGRAQYTMAYAQDKKITYTAVGEIMPSRPGFDSGDFNWSIDNADVASVDGAGKITPLKAGDVLLRVEPKNADDMVLFRTQICEVALHFRELPSCGEKSLYVLENTYQKLRDVKFPEGWEGWSWKYPNTPIVINGENRQAYSFEAVYAGESHYPDKQTLSVKIGRVTGISAYETEGRKHNNVLETGSVDDEGKPTEDSDFLTLCVETLFRGDINCDENLNYTWNMEVNAPAGIVLKEGDYKKTDDGRLQKNFTVTAVKKGSYTLKPVIKVTDPKTKKEKVLAKTSFKIQAVEEKQAYIILEPELEAGIKKEQGRIVADFSGSVKSFRIGTKLLDRNGEEAAFEQAKLTWSVSDKKVATVKASKDTRSAEVMFVGEGHTVLTAKVKDKAGHTATAQLEIRNTAPRVDVSKVAVNPAYDYETVEGRRLACENGGAVEIVPVYTYVGVGTVRIFQKDKKKLETELELIKYDEGGTYKYLVCPADSVKEKVYDCYLGVENFSDSSEPCFYPLKVTVKTKLPQVTVKSARTANLFYRTDPASVDISTAQKGVVIESVRWTDSAEGEGNGFSSVPSDFKFDQTKKGKNVERLYFAQESVELTAGKQPAEPGIVSGKMEIRCMGYRDPIEKSVSLKWNYKKPTMIVKEKQATLIPSLEGHAKGSFVLYNEEMQRLYSRNDPGEEFDPRICYQELTFQNKDVQKSGYRDYTYVGNKTTGSEKLTMTIVSDFWREPLKAVHTMKFVNPTPYLTKKKLVVNTGQISTAYTDIELKNAYTAELSCDDIIIEGKNAKAQALLDEELLEMAQDGAVKNRIVLRVNRARTMRQETIRNGTYAFKVTPCFRDASGKRIKGKTLTLKIQATNRAVTAKVKLSGSLDLTRKRGEDKNCVEIRTSLQNIGDNYVYENRNGGLGLSGEYSDYFSISFFDSDPGRYRIRMKAGNEGKLKARQKYRLAIRYTLKLENGDTVQVYSPTFTIRPKQSSPKVTVHGNAQILYAGNDEITRTCGFELPDGMGYRITGLTGGIDCNRDGKEDVVVSYVKKDSTETYASAKIKLTDRDGVLTMSGAKGKTYKIPVTIRLAGRDGIAKDVRTSIKVTVRR